MQPTSISIHALREEGDFPVSTSLRVSFYFYPRPPRGGRRVAAGITVDIAEISIHALREEGDALCQKYRRPESISIHALREEGDAFVIFVITPFGIFLSTPSARRATASE